MSLSPVLVKKTEKIPYTEAVGRVNLQKAQGIRFLFHRHWPDRAAVVPSIVTERRAGLVKKQGAAKVQRGTSCSPSRCREQPFCLFFPSSFFLSFPRSLALLASRIAHTPPLDPRYRVRAGKQAKRGGKKEEEEGGGGTVRST